MKKPAGVIVVAGFLWFAAFVSLIVGFMLLVPGTPLDIVWRLNRPAHEAFQAIGRMAGAGFAVLAFVGAIAAIGFARGRRWAWWMAVVAMVANIAGDVIGVFVKRDLVRNGSGALIAGAFLFLLLSRPVRLFFSARQDKGKRTS